MFIKMRALRDVTRASFAVCMLFILFCSKSAASMDCSMLNGCIACAEQPQSSIPKLPPGYKVAPQMLAARTPLVANAPNTAAKVQNIIAEAAESEATAPSGGENKLTTAFSTVEAASGKIFGKRRRILLGLGAILKIPISSMFTGKKLPADAGFMGASSSPLPAQQQQQQQQVVPQLPVPARGGPNIAFGGIFAGNNQQMEHAASMPMVLAAPASAAVDGSSMGVPLLFPTVPQQQAMNILVTDPRNTTGPHPWDVLLFKTNQFNTSRPAYRLGGLGLMLMSDFNQSQPLTDWHVLQHQQQQQQPENSQSWNLDGSNAAAFGANAAGFGSSSSSTGYISSSGGSGSRLAAPPAGSSESFGFGGPMSKSPAEFGDRAPQFTPRFSSFFKPPAVVLDGDKLAANVDRAAASVPANSSTLRLWCTACQAPAYQLTAYGSCVCAAGYGRLMDSKTPYACVKCPIGQVAATAAPLTAPTGKPTPIKLQPAEEAAQEDKSVLAICQQCSKGMVPNQAKTACVAP